MAKTGGGWACAGHLVCARGRGVDCCYPHLDRIAWHLLQLWAHWDTSTHPLGGVLWQQTGRDKWLGLLSKIEIS